ncbi:MAG: membrane protein insertase YidC [Pseudonocardiaceae bacterium]|nr:membrane protein insertase YidC [Pseudonocardiaceae bacterium]
MLDFIYYPVSAIMWFWHKVFSALPFLGPVSGISWALSVIFLVFTLRALLIKPFVSQVRSMRKMAEFAPEIQKLKKKHGDDRQKQAAEMQKLQSEHGFNPLGGCLPIFVQLPVFFGLFHVLRMFNRPGLTYEQNIQIPNYVFPASDVKSFLDARLFGAPISGWITMPADQLSAFAGVTRVDMALVAVPLMILAGILTHMTSRHSVARQTEAQAANPQSAIMNKVMLYLFPIGVVVGGPFFPLAILLYWLSNNGWTLGQQYVIYRKIDAEEAEKKETAVAERQALGPRPGQKPSRSKKSGASPGGGAGEPAAGSNGESTGAGGAGPEASNGEGDGSGTGDGEAAALGTDGAGTTAEAGQRSANGSSDKAKPEVGRPRTGSKKSNRKRR